MLFRLSRECHLHLPTPHILPISILQVIARVMPSNNQKSPAGHHSSHWKVVPRSVSSMATPLFHTPAFGLIAWSFYPCPFVVTGFISKIIERNWWCRHRARSCPAYLSIQPFHSLPEILFTEGTPCCHNPRLRFGCWRLFMSSRTAWLNACWSFMPTKNWDD